MMESDVSVRALLFNLDLNSVVVTVGVGSAAVAAATTPLALDVVAGSASCGLDMDRRGISTCIKLSLSSFSM